jgi:acyl carrier protein
MGDVAEQREQSSFKDAIKRIVSRISHIDVSELQDHLKVREELGIDSLMTMEIVATCEKRLGLTIDETTFADAQTVGDFLALMVALRKSQNV